MTFFEIPEELKKLQATGEAFLQYDSEDGSDPPRFLVFISQRGLKLLEECKEGSTDTTFR